MGKRMVFAFSTPETSQSEVHHPFKALREAIERIPGAQLIESSAEEVDGSAIDSEGRYFPTESR
jgi:hypothetical protein